MSRSNAKDPSYVVVRLRVPENTLDRTFKAQHFDARADARTFATGKNASRKKFDKQYSVLPVFPGPISRKK